MKLLVLAQTPPPVHGQSLMVRTLVEGLPGRGIFVSHVNLGLSRDSADIGRWRPGKIFATLGAATRTIRARFRDGSDTLYYVPAPGKRGALYRDLVLMALCRPFFRRLVLHWHATGLAAWLDQQGFFFERWLAHGLLGRAHLSIALSPVLRSDAAAFTARQITVVPNGVDLPNRGPSAPEKPSGHSRLEVLFLGLGSRSKGLFDCLEAIALANQVEPGAFRLTFAGGFASTADEQEFQARVAPLGETVRHVGFVDETQKHDLLAQSHTLCFPTSYAHEGQPLVIIEALAHNLPIITTRWRAIPEILPDGDGVWFVEPGQPAQLAAALDAARRAPRLGEHLRQHYLAHFTREHHLAALASALAALDD